MNIQISLSISDYLYLGIKCSCGKVYQFAPELNIWNNPVIKCGCGEKYLPFYNGFAYPLVFKNKEWIIFSGEIFQKKD